MVGLLHDLRHRPILDLLHIENIETLQRLFDEVSLVLGGLIKGRNSMYLYKSIQNGFRLQFCSLSGIAMFLKSSHGFLT